MISDKEYEAAIAELRAIWDQLDKRGGGANRPPRYQKTELAIKNLRAQIKKAEFSQQVTLNTQIKQQEQRLKQLAEHL